VTVTLDLIAPGALAELADSLGGLPRVLLRDTDSETDPGPVIQPASAEMPAVGDRAARLQLFGEIARGGMGAVLKGRDPDLGRDVAVKVLLEAHRDNPDLVRRFVEEAQIGGQLQHPGIVPIYELGAFPDRRPYFAMKLVKGRTLSSLLAERPDPADHLPRLLSIFEDVCQTMAYAHARGVIHRDLKPSNVMVGSFGEVQVMDWGLAKVLARGGAADDASAGRKREPGTIIATSRDDSAPALSRAGSVLGTPSYMAPEQARGEVDQLDERCDVFALGSILCEILTGAPAFTGRSPGDIQRQSARGDLSVALDHLHGCGADPALIALAVACLSPERDDRPRNASDIAERIGAYRTGVQERLRRAEIAGAEEKARAEEATKRARVERDRRRLTVALAASVLGLVLLGGGGWAYLAQLRAARRAAIERVVTEVLDEAILLRGQAKMAAVGDLSNWSDAVATARQAAVLLNTGEPDKALRDRVDSLVAVLLREQREATDRAAEVDRDRRFLERLAMIQFEGRERGARWADLAYLAGFRGFGIDLEMVDPAEAGRFLANRSVPTELAYYLFDWVLQLQYVPNTKERQARLIETADIADSDPWRIKIRKHIMGPDYETIRQMASDEKALSAQPASGLLLLASVLYESPYFEGGGAIIRRVLQRAWRLQPDNFLVCNTLGSYIGYADDLGNEDFNVRFCTAAVALRPGSALAHYRLANMLVTLPELGLSEPQFRDRIALPSISERLQEAVAELREAVRLRPEVGSFHRDLGCALFLTENGHGDAVEEYRKSIKLDPESADHDRLELAYLLFNAGKPTEAVSVLREHLRLLREGPSFRRRDLAELEAQLREFERLAELEGRLASTLRGQNVPADAEGKLEVARLCRAKRHFAAAARFYREAFETKPALADDLASQLRLHAAIAAALAGAGPRPAGDVPLLNDADRARWRAQALDWLRAERDTCARIFREGPRAELSVAQETLDILAHHRDLAALRNEAKMRSFPEAERNALEAFWSEVDALLRQARGDNP
jgi:serine/threonine-protein kinase